MLFWKVIAILLFFTSTTASEYLASDEYIDYSLEQGNVILDSKCFSSNEKENSLHSKFASKNQNEKIGIQVTKRLTHQLSSRVFKIFLQEILGYKNVKLYETTRSPNAKTDPEEIYYYLFSLLGYTLGMTHTLIDLEIWSYSDAHIKPHNVNDAGVVSSPGRFGLFIPDILIKSTDDFPKMYPYTILQEDRKNAHLEKFYLSDNMIERVLGKYTEHHCNGECNAKGIHVSDSCVNNTDRCALVLAPHFTDTSFIIHHIKELKLKVKIIWTGKYIKRAIKDLLRHLLSENNNKKFLIFHWTPSEVVNAENLGTKFTQITMPRCEDMISSTQTGCRYELTPLLKYYNNEFEHFAEAYESFLRFNFNKNDFKGLIKLYEKYEDHIVDATEWAVISDTYNRIACEWMQQNKQVYEKWLPTIIEKPKINIGAILPITGRNMGYQKLEKAMQLAENKINSNNSILPHHQISVIETDGQCQPDTVMKNFINFYTGKESMVGVLGPACTDTMEPVVGLSKHFRMIVISYSAEGAMLSDKEKYPYFFRTIGENKQYEYVYTSLFKKFNWNRVAALNEDGQRSTEYISHMEATLKQNHIDLISNKKFPRERKEGEMGKQLADLKAKNARIIIADLDENVASLVMCEAYKLQMTAEHGYVWFLPMWLFNIWSDLNSTQCSSEELFKAINGHFSLTHSPFADENSFFDLDNKTVREWKNELIEETGPGEISNYAGYAYDAIWVYALALDKLIEEDQSYLSSLHSERTTNRLMEIIKATDFNGVSGRIRFGTSGSRYTVVNIIQWLNGNTTIVGNFTPDISEPGYTLVGGYLNLDNSAIRWLTKNQKPPDDGSINCGLAPLARFLNTGCEVVSFLLVTISCITCILTLSAASFIFWKRKYDKKIKTSVTFLKNFGIDLSKPSALPLISLDKWEIPKDRVVINRRLGDGAFGTVYGGEAQIEGPESGWTAVAVKTLKIGSTTEDKVDFLAEAESMKRFDHKNIIKLLGVCLQTEPVFTIMEFMLYGDLKTYLLARRNLVSSKTKEGDDSEISAKRLTMMALDVARALSYLTEQRYVHRDVACRNCLINAQKVVKLGDFGMARSTFESDYYRFNRKGMLPVRWMSPEAIQLGLFTPASDVWSYGVLLYEIITFGGFPYQGLTNNQVLEKLKDGGGLTIPNGIKPQLEALLRSCWNLDSKIRPAASEITEYLSNHPRILTPCLDAPLSAVQMAETESDELELLPGLRRRTSTFGPSIKLSNALSQTTVLSNNGSQACNRSNVTADSNGYVPHDDMFNMTNTLAKGVKLHEFVSTNETFPREDLSQNQTNNIYNPIEPLIKKATILENSLSISNSSLLRYVPMFGFGRTRSIGVCSQISGEIVSNGVKSTSTSVL